MVNDQMTSPFFSVVIPVYNRFRMMQDTVESVLGQRFREFEILLIDDGSDDGSGELMTEAYGNHPQIRVIHQQNLERGAARNHGYRKAKGAYVVFLDSDDLLLPDHLEVLYFHIQRLNPDFIATKYEFLRDGKRKPSSVSDLSEGYYNYRLLLDGNVIACNVTIRRNNPQLFLFVEDRKFSVKEDWLFLLQNLRHQQLYLIDKVTLLMVDHDQRSMKTDNEKLITKTLLAREWIAHHIEMDAADRKRLEAHINYFCAIHSYLENNRKKSLHFIFQAFRKGGIRIKYLVLLIKAVIGRKFVVRVIHGS